MPPLVHVKPLNRWDNSSIRPGPVGSVGDVMLQTRLRSSNPDLPIRWDKTFKGQNASLYGSSLSDGGHRSYNTGAIGNRVINRNWAFGRRFITKCGWYVQDLRAPDKRVEPYMGALPQYEWRNKIAEVQNAKRTGNLFEYQGAWVNDGSPLRGGMYPRVTNVEGGILVPNNNPMLSQVQQPVQKTVTVGRINR